MQRNDLSNLSEYDWMESDFFTYVDNCLAGNWRVSTPLLHNITIHHWECTYRARLSDQRKKAKSDGEKQVKSACKEQGVDFDVVV